MRRIPRRFVLNAVLAAMALFTIRCGNPAPDPTALRTAFASTAPTAKPSVPVCAIGDLHGDIEVTRKALQLCGATDEQAHWVGGNLVVVQTGDLLDRGDSEKEIIGLFRRLGKEASEVGGALHVLLGNHELLNVGGDFRYVTSAGLRAYDELAPTAASDPRFHRFPPGQLGRAAAFLPGGPEARFLENRALIAVIDGNVFVHGGLLPKHADYGIARLNDETRRWVRGERAQLPAIMLEEDGPSWLRRYSENRQLDAPTCAELTTTLKKIGAQRMIVGHSVREEGISAACGGRVWRIDVGMARFYQRHILQVLYIEGAHVTVREKKTAPK